MHQSCVMCICISEEIILKKSTDYCFEKCENDPGGLRKPETDVPGPTGK